MRVVAEGSNGREAIAQFGEQRPDVTLMDLQMPEMSGRSRSFVTQRQNGIDVAGAVRRNEACHC